MRLVNCEYARDRLVVIQLKVLGQLAEDGHSSETKKHRGTCVSLDKDDRR